MIKKLILVIVIALGTSALSQAQSYYDDDIYYNASKAKKEKQEQEMKNAEKIAAANYVPNKSVDFPGADTYTVSSNSTRDVDEYNRRGGMYSRDSIKGDSILGTIPFTYTRQIERFHNPDIVEGSGDETLQYLYYASENEREKVKDVTQVNIYLDSPWGWWGSWPYYNWGWGPGWWGGWYYPSWSFYWDFGPGWNWGWGPGWNWGWGPGWNWGWGPGWAWGGPGWIGPGWGGGPAPVRPTSPGAMATHRPAGNWQAPTGGHRGGTSGVTSIPSTTTRSGQRAGAAAYNNRNTSTNRTGSTYNSTRNSSSRGTSFGTSSGGSRGGNLGGGATHSSGGSSGRGGRH